jgi:hypothetical protein
MPAELDRYNAAPPSSGAAMQGGATKSRKKYDAR